jgi:hypothetical protein
LGLLGLRFADESECTKGYQSHIIYMYGLNASSSWL